jgi:hypothetical protein
MSPTFVANTPEAELPKAIDAFYRALAGVHHPDRQGDAARMSEISDLREALADPAVLKAVRADYLRSTVIAREVSAMRQLLRDLKLEDGFRGKVLAEMLRGKDRAGTVHLPSARNIEYSIHRSGGIFPGYLKSASESGGHLFLVVDETGGIAERKSNAVRLVAQPHKVVVGAIDLCDLPDFTAPNNWNFRAHEADRMGKRPHWVQRAAHAFSSDASDVTTGVADSAVLRAADRDLKLRELRVARERAERAQPKSLVALEKPEGYSIDRVWPAQFEALAPYFTSRIPEQPKGQYCLVTYCSPPDLEPHFSLEGKISAARSIAKP